MKTKKLLTMCLLAFLGNMAVHAYDIVQNGIYLNITGDNTAEVTYVVDGEDNAVFYSGDVSIPRLATKDNVIYTVTAIGDKAFNNCSDVTSVTIPNTVTTIGGQAFQGCSSLTTINIPEGVTYIGVKAFNDCTKLSSVTLPSTLQKIDGEAFLSNSSLTSIIIPGSVTEIGLSAFNGCSSLASVSLPDGLTKIGDYAFYCCWPLSSISIPETVTEIGVAAFQNCALTSANIPSGIKTISGYLFCGCPLASITIPDGVTSIGEWAFHECNLSSIVIPESVETIGGNAFSSNESPIVFIMNPTPATIGNADIFYGASCIYVPNESVETYKNTEGWSTYADRITPLTGWAFDAPVSCGEGTVDLTFKVTSNRPWEVEVSASPEDIAGALTIPAMVEYNGLQFAVKSIGKHAFDGGERENAHSMTSVTIAEGITTIDEWAFQNCPELETVILPESVENIYGAAFAYSPKLSAINIPTRLKTIYDWLFVNCTALKSIDLPEGITEIKNNAFRGSGLESIKFPTTLTSVGKGAFQTCESLTSIDFNDCTATLESDIFSWCSSLEEVYVPKTVTLMGLFTFACCQNLKKAVFEEGNPSEGLHETFTGDLVGSSLEEVVLPSTAIMGEGFFRKCTNLKTVTFLSGDPGEMHFANNFQGAPDDVLFIIPEGTAESYLKRGYHNISDKGALYKVRELFEDQAERITTMADALTDGDKATLNAAINTAHTAVNAADDYLAIYAQIDAIKEAAKTYLATATLTKDFDVTAAMITNSDNEFYDIGWTIGCLGEHNGWQGENDEYIYTNGDCKIQNFLEGWRPDNTLSNGKHAQTVTNLPAGIYRLECDAIATWGNDASVEVTGVSLFAGNTKTTIATENQKPQHFSVKFENATARDVTIGIDINGTNANWVAMDNVRLIYEGKAADIPQGADLVSDENAHLYLYNVETGKYLSAGHSYGQHAILDETGLPLRLTQNEETGLWQIYFWEGSKNQQLLYHHSEYGENTFVDYNDNPGGNTWWYITQTAEGSYLIQNEMKIGSEEYLGNDPSKQDLQDNYNGVSFTDVNATVSVEKNTHWLLFTKDNCDLLTAKHRLMDAILRMESSASVNDDLLTTARNIYENADATLVEIIDITTLLNSQMGMPKTDEPVDMAALIINPRFENNTTEGWSGANVVGGRSDATSNQEQEFFEKDFNMYQVITGVPNGRYLLKWKGFHRPGDMDDVLADYLSGTNNSSAVVYANETQKTMLHLGVGMTDEQVNGLGTLSGGKYVPSSMEDARAYFDAALYADELEVEVTDNVLTIGVKNTQPMSGGHWVIFSDFELYIMENEEQLYHKLTADNVKCVPGCLTAFNVNLLNRDDVTAFQFDVELPEGVSIYEENGQKEAELTNRGNGHMFQCIKTGENTYQFSALSLASKSFKKNEGPIVRMTLTTDGSKELGDYPIKVKNTELSKPNGMMVLPFDFTSTLTIKAADPGDVNGDGKITVTDAVYVFKYVNGETPEHFQMRAADVNNSNSITINDAVQIVNMILGNGQTMSSRAAKKLLRQLAREY